MITEWFITLWRDLVLAVIGWFETDWEVPSFLLEFDDFVNGFLANVAGLGAWVDWVYVFVVIGAVLVVWTVGLGLKLARAIAAHIPFVGGAG